MTSAEWNVISFETITFLTVYKNNYKTVSRLKLNAKTVKKVITLTFTIFYLFAYAPNLY